MASSFLSVLVALLALAAGAYQLHFKNVFEAAAVFGRPLTPVGNQDCTTVPELRACEKIVLHQPTGYLFAACSTPESRTKWTPALLYLNATARSRDDFVAVYDPATQTVTRLQMEGLADPRGFNSHGMDVVTSAWSPNELVIYLVNQRPPFVEDTPRVHTDASVEIFKYTLGGKTLKHMRTVDHAELIPSPNDVVGTPDGKSFWVTNDANELRGFQHWARFWLRTKRTSVTYCEIVHGCKTAISKMPGANGLARSADGEQFYLANAQYPEFRILEHQADGTLVETDIIKIPHPIDNVSVDKNGAIWLAGAPHLAHRATKHFADPSISDPSSGVRVSLNTGRSAFFGEKYKIEKLFEDDGTLASGATTVVYDVERSLFFSSGLSSPHLTVCKLQVPKGEK